MDDFKTITLKNIGQQLSEARIARNLSQADLAKLSGVPQAHIARIEFGKANITIGTLCSLLSVLSLSLEIK